MIHIVQYISGHVALNSLPLSCYSASSFYLRLLSLRVFKFTDGFMTNEGYAALLAAFNLTAKSLNGRYCWRA